MSQQLEPEQFEIENVQKVYNVIAKHFSNTRHCKWPGVVQYINGLDSGSTILDIGCGNGKYMDTRTDCKFIGTDSSSELVKICGDKGYEAVVSNALSLPFSSNSFDAFICIAMLHHLSTDERRTAAIKEASRVIKPGCTGLIYVWSFENGGQRKNGTTRVQKSQDSLIEWNIPKKFLTNPNGARATAGSKPSDIRYHRYYHMFKEYELDRLVESIEGLEIVSHFYDRQNWAVVIKKIK